MNVVLRFGAIASVLCVSVDCMAADSLRFEAEDCVVNRDAVVKDAFPPDKWTLWSTDRDAHKKWSGGMVLKSPVVQEDRATPEDGAAPLRLVVRNIPKGTYDVIVRTARALAVSPDGKQWRRLSGNVLAAEVQIESGTYEFWVDDRYAVENPKARGSSYVDWIELQPFVGFTDGVWNGGFEDFTGGAPSGWSVPKPTDTLRMELVHDVVHSGKTALHVDAKGDRDLRWSCSCARRSPVEPGSTVCVSAWVQGTCGYTAYIRVDAYDGGTRIRYFAGRAVLTDAEDWTRVRGFINVPDNASRLSISVYGCGSANVYVDDLSLLPATLPKPEGPKVNGWASTRVTEKLGRGVVAMRTPQGAYVSWRLLESDPVDIGFNVFRIVDGNAPLKLNTAPVVQTCDFRDRSAPASGKVVYRVAPAGRSGASSGHATLVETPYLSIPVKEPGLKMKRPAVGDLDGDGAYDFVVKHGKGGTDPHRGFWHRAVDTCKIDAYRSDGTFLWRRDLGWSIELGTWYTPSVVYDVDGDGRAEVIAKTGEGDPRDADGRVFSGPEYLTVMDGLTGRDIAQAPWPSRKGYDYNNGARHQLAIAYLDGRTPCIVALRGTYSRMKAEAWQLKDGKLERLWSYDNAELPHEYWCQGAHTTRIADVDGDGRDEVGLGSVMLDDNGAPLWTNGRGHPDGFNLGDILPSRPGLEVFYCYETPQKTDGGLSLADARTGELIWKLPVRTYHCHTAGVCSDIDSTTLGVECYGIDIDPSCLSKKRANRGWLYSAAGEIMRTGTFFGYGVSTIFWDADLQCEVRRGRIRDYQGGVLGGQAAPGGGIVADVVGDWREEIIVCVPGEIRVYPTTIPAMDRRVCLMQDPVYRLGICTASMGYSTRAMLSYCPSATAPNVSVTFMDEAEPAGCRVVVSAAQDRAFKGKLRLLGEGNLVLEKAAFDIDLAPGELVVHTTALTPEAAGQAMKGRVRAELVTATRVLRGEAPVQGAGRPAARGIMIEAEDFSAEGGGQVHKRSDKKNVHGLAISHWDDKGHFLEWTVDVPANGRYLLAVRYCTPYEVRRSLQVGRREPAQVVFPTTGGFGSDRHDWTEVTLADANGKRFRLEKGKHVIRLVNTDDQGLNLDYLTLVQSNRR